MFLMRHHPLVRHLSTPCPQVTGIDVCVSTRPDGGLHLTYTLSGDVSGLRVPEAAEPRRRDGLWQHTCFETFVMAHDSTEYREFNFSPSGEWAAYAFQAYRKGGPLEPMHTPAIDSRVCEVALELAIELPRSALPDTNRLRLALSAVIEDRAGTLSYWALRHPPGKPDFHHTYGFALELR
jgi:hypothetical protein